MSAETMSERDAVGFIIFLIVIAIIAFAMGTLIGCCNAQTNFIESLCRDMPTTEEYFQCKVSNDFNSKYKLVKR